MTFVSLVAKFGMDLEKCRPFYESIQDIIPFEGPQKVTTGLSGIDGIGLFAMEYLSSGDRIVTMRRGRYRTPAGRYTNHSDTPNATICREGEDWWLMACRDIHPHEEIVIDYRGVLEMHKNE